MAVEEGKLIDPADRVSGQTNRRKLGGRPKGLERAYEKKHKPLAAPLLRRDPSAHEKLAIVERWQAALREEGIENVEALPNTRKRTLD